MTSFSSVTGKDLLVALKKVGFFLVRVRGSHHFIQHMDGRATVVPVHAGENIGPGLLDKIFIFAKQALFNDENFTKDKLEINSSNDIIDDANILYSLLIRKFSGAFRVKPTSI
jgi:predicted RNA binding protein YcfA (HicA-like mRNA interferase family)